MSLRSAAILALTLCLALTGCGQSSSNPPAVRVQSGTTRPGEARPPMAVGSQVTAANPTAANDTVSPVSDDYSTAGESDGVTFQPESYLSDDDVFALIVRPEELSNSVVLSTLIEQFSLADQVGVDSSEMEWVCVSGTASTFDVGREMESITVAARTTTPVDIEQLVKSKFPNAHTETVSQNGQEYVQLTGITNQSLEMVTDEQGRTSAVKRIHSVPTMALYQSDSNTVVFCAEHRLNGVLTSASGQALRTLLSDSSTNAPVVLAATGWGDELALPVSLSMFVPHLNDVIRCAQSVVVKFQPDSERVLATRIYTAPGHGVGRLMKATTNCHGETCERIAGFGALAAVELRPIIDEVLELFKGAVFFEHQDSVELALTSQGGLTRICEGLSALMQPTVASR